MQFNLGGKDWVRVGSQCVELFQRGQVQQCPTNNIATFSIAQGVFTVRLKDAKSGFLGIGSKGIFSFNYAGMANARPSVCDERASGHPIGVGPVWRLGTSAGELERFVMDVATAISEISALSVDDRIRVVEAVWDSIADDPGDLSLTPAQEAELKRRIAAHEAAPHETIPWEEVKAGLVQRLRG